MKINLKNGVASSVFCFTFWSSKRFFYLFLLLIFACPNNTLANGAVGGPGLYGNEIVVSDSSSINNLVVDEDVILNYQNKTVKVDYKIINNSSKTVNFNMVFPIDDHRIDCNAEILKESIEDNSYETELNFRVFLNRKKLSSKQVFLSDIKLEGVYKKLRETVCYSFLFPIQLQPGSNLLQVNYNMIPSISWSDGFGGRLYYSYAIWPAKNWVSVFRKALWRIYLPGKSKREQDFFTEHNLKHQFEDWYTRGNDTRLFNWLKYSFDVQGPGTKIQYPDHIDLVADNFVPDASIVINVYMHELSQIVEGCEPDELKDCWQKALRSTLSHRPYRGHQSCYDESDLNLIMVKHSSHINQFIFFEQTVSFLRNEIFARKGYIFTSDNFRLFFEQMPWYKPEQQNVKLNNVEKWNIDFLQMVEKEIKVEQDINKKSDKLTHIYNRMKNTCPTYISGQ